MKKIVSAPVEKLYACLQPERVPYADSRQIPHRQRILPPQPRALAALELALGIRDPGYNIFLSGEVNLGRTYMIKDFLAPRVKKCPCPPDLVYVYNFDNADSPLLLSLPAGQGRKLKGALNKSVSRLRKELPVYMERESYTQRRSSLLGGFQNKKTQIFEDMDKVAVASGFKLDLDENGTMSLYPLFDGQRLNEEEFEKLAENKKSNIKRKGDKLANAMHSYLRKLGRMDQDLMNGERSLERDVAGELVNLVIAPMAEKFHESCNGQFPSSYFGYLKEDILDHLDYFLPQDSGPGQQPFMDGPHFDDIEHRYDVNIFVDNSKTNGAPLILEDHPTQGNLLGQIERESEMGALVTNFTLIKAGSLHKANGGFLVLQMEDLIQHPAAWEGLLRSLRAGQAKMDDFGDGDGIKTKGLRPAPLPLDLKVILIGSDDLYEALLLADSRFSKLFKIKAQMTGRMLRTAKNVKTYLIQVRRIIEEASLLHFEREALAGIVDFGSLLLEDQKNLSLEFPLIREIMVESSAQAASDGAKMVGKVHLDKALEAREFRMNLIEEVFMEDYDRKIIKMNTGGEAIGLVNGLSVTGYGDYEFGLPHQIACTVGVGHGGIVDFEREAELGGPIHTKAIMILKSYLVAQFARKKPLILTGSICFEQSYVGIEGDSASGAELAALLSAIAEVPIRLSLAFTGALSQSGQIMAVGGVTHKIEGYFEVCRRHGLSGTQGVILPKDNLEQLMLKRPVLDAIEAGKFHIYPVEHISQAMELLTGMPCGVRRKDGSFTPGSLFRLVDKRLTELGKLAAKNGKSKF